MFSFGGLDFDWVLVSVGLWFELWVGGLLCGLVVCLLGLFGLR